MPSSGEEFLARAGISKEECHAITKSMTGSNDIFPVYYQIMQSYTMQGGAVVVQFREKPIDLEIHETAMEIHKAYVLPITCKQSELFYIYVTPYGGRRVLRKNSVLLKPLKKPPSETLQFSLLRALNVLPKK